ncbi:MAG: hypothetical protein AAF211_09330 [Myxococcota bacterium]
MTDRIWIDLPADDATPELERLTRGYRNRGRAVPGIIAAMKPSPDTLKTVLRMNEAVTFGGSVLGRAREELVAASTSALNDCFY